MTKNAPPLAWAVPWSVPSTGWVPPPTVKSWPAVVLSFSTSTELTCTNAAAVAQRIGRRRQIDRQRRCRANVERLGKTSVHVPRGVPRAQSNVRLMVHLRSHHRRRRPARQLAFQLRRDDGIGKYVDIGWSPEKKNSSLVIGH
jgi:hypothetical protein